MQILLRFMPFCFALAVCMESGASIKFKGVDYEPHRLDSNLSYGTENSFKSVSGIVPYGVNTVGIRQYAIVDQFDSTKVDEGTLPGRNFAQLRAEIIQERNLGLKTYFTLGTSVADGEMRMPGVRDEWLAWHGAIDLGTPADIDQWFFEYGNLLKKYALLANEERVAVFSIANELVSMSSTKHLEAFTNDMYWLYATPHPPRFEKYAEICLKHLIKFKNAVEPQLEDADLENDLLQWFSQNDGKIPIQDLYKNFILRSENLRRAYLEMKWRTLIAEVSKIYKSNFSEGLLTMNANHGHVYSVGFWDALDLIAVSTYYNLTGVDQNGVALAGPTDVANLSIGWQKVISELTQFLTTLPKASQKPVIFSELGYTDRVYSAAIPWASVGVHKVKLANDFIIDQDFATRKIDELERVHALGALDQEINLNHLPWLDGILLWDFYPQGFPKMDSFQLFYDLGDATSQEVKNLFR